MSKKVQITEYIDWKDTEGLIKSFTNSLKEMGITVVDNPDVEGSDMFSFILMSEDCTDEEVFNEIKDNIPCKGEELRYEENERLAWVWEKLQDNIFQIGL